MTSETLLHHFSKFGEVSDLQFQVQSGRNSSSALVNACLTCSSPTMAQSILRFRPHQVAGHNLKVTEFMEEKELAAYVAAARRCRIYIKRLPLFFDDRLLKSVFEKFGPVQKAYSVRGAKARKNWKYGYVVFESAASLAKLPKGGVCYRGNYVEWTSHEKKKEKRAAKKKSSGRKKPCFEKPPEKGSYIMAATRPGKSFDELPGHQEKPGRVGYHRVDRNLGHSPQNISLNTGGSVRNLKWRRW